MMAILNLRQELPRDRVNLYEQASLVLLHSWDIEYHELPQVKALGINKRQLAVKLYNDRQYPIGEICQMDLIDSFWLM